MKYFYSILLSKLRLDSFYIAVIERNYADNPHKNSVLSMFESWVHFEGLFTSKKFFFYSQKVTLPIGLLTKQTIVTNRLRCLRKYFCSADNFKNIFSLFTSKEIFPRCLRLISKEIVPPPPMSDMKWRSFLE
jgi:hypothetical protein